MRDYQVLMIEPDHILGDVYKNHLEKFNYRVRLCNDVQQAINDIDALEPDLIILELKMKGHNGYEFLYELRSYPEWQNIPVIIHSMIPEGDTGLDQGSKAELGIVEYLYKPTSSLGKLHYEINKLFFVNTPK